MKEEPQSRITWHHASILLAVYKGVKDWMLKQSSQAALLESAHDWKVQLDVNDAGDAVKG